MAPADTKADPATASTTSTTAADADDALFLRQSEPYRSDEKDGHDDHDDHDDHDNVVKDETAVEDEAAVTPARSGSATSTSTATARSNDIHVGSTAPPPQGDASTTDAVADAPPNPNAAGDLEKQAAAAETVPPRYSVHSTWAKRWIVLGASLGAFISPLTGQIYLPALTEIAAYFHITDGQVNLTVTTYMIFQGVTPMFLGGMADGIGRRPTFLLCFVIFIAANIGLALCRNYASLLVVRMIQSAGSASTVALCQAVVADIVSSAERGQYIGITIIPIVFAPSLGPVLGGVLSEYLGWQAIFWFLAIVGAVLGLGLAFFLPETCRKIVGDGSIQPHPFHRTGYQLVKDALARRKANGTVAQDNHDTAAARPPLRMQVPNLTLSVQLALQKNIGLLLLYSSLLFAGFYAIATNLPASLQAYGLSQLEIGLCYLPIAAGSIMAAFAVGPFINRNYRRHAARIGVAVDAARQHDLSNFPIEQARLETGLPLYYLSSAIMLVWGWALQRHAHLAVLCVLLFLNGVGMIGFQNAANALLVDITPGRAGAAVAANNLTRCLIGAVATAVINPMIAAMGIGWAFFLIGALYVAASPGLFLLMFKGVAWRRRARENAERRQQRRAERKAQKEAQKASRAATGS
ncbi:hypothetical protein HMPREF1624_08379 [Sporothrix schenckii ATCC 58251]|uniref:Major facilitator superfamily (MFS) profile domain-containing protein n=1 Tax=Sporothrix schenckii (strain ATCC 58251 / de Perez 2211183) TaxID=1391915 RepID=U7PHV5_SPOS1|nr:hypothetical protein HMPREF1624_08379 [Sporothrix schenckii ATCC 58251]